jgi:hypothetical protein
MPVSEFEQLLKYQCEKNVVCLRFRLLYLYIVKSYPYTAQVCPWADSEAATYGGERYVKNLKPQGWFVRN